MVGWWKLNTDGSSLGNVEPLTLWDLGGVIEQVGFRKGWPRIVFQMFISHNRN